MMTATMTMVFMMRIIHMWLCYMSLALDEIEQSFWPRIRHGAHLSAKEQHESLQNKHQGIGTY